MPDSEPKQATPLIFNNNGNLQEGSIANIALGTMSSADVATFRLDFRKSMQQNTDDNKVLGASQNGYKPDNMVSYHINNGGTLVGQYSNEQSQLLGQVVLINFATRGDLDSKGDNVWSETRSSGIPLLGTAGSGNFGLLAWRTGSIKH